MRPMSRRVCGVVLASAVVTGLTLLCWAAPLVPGRAAVPDTWMSLADTKRLVLSVSRMPQGMTDAGITTELVADQWKAKLIEAGIEVLDADTPESADAPVLQLVVLSGTEPDIPDIMLTVMYATLTQTARFDRLDMSLRVPTYTHPVASMEPKNNLGRSVRDDLDRMIEAFVERLRLADEEMKNLKGGQ